MSNLTKYYRPGLFQQRRCEEGTFRDEELSSQEHRQVVSNVSTSSPFLSRFFSSCISFIPTLFIRRRKRCGLVPLLRSLLLLLMGCCYCGMTRGVLTSSSSSNSENLIPELVASSQQQQQQQQQHANSLIQSVWDTVRASLEAAAATRKSSESHHSSSTEDDNDDDNNEDELGNNNPAKYARAVTPRNKNDPIYYQVTSRRRALLEQSLRRHYAQYLQQHGTKPLDSSYFAKQQQQKSNTTTPASSHHDHNSNDHESSSSWSLGDGCVAFNEHHKSYWTYIWCSQQFLQQVHLPKIAEPGGGSGISPGYHSNDNAMIQQLVANGGQTHELGSYQVHKDNDVHSDAKTNELPWHFTWTRSYLEHLATTMATTLQRFRIEEYGHGDWCQPVAADAVERETLVVIFNAGEAPCHGISNGHYDKTPQILGVQEILPCRYVLHVCAQLEHETAPTTTEKEEKEDVPVVDQAERIPEALSSSNDERKGTSEENDEASQHNHNIKEFVNHVLYESAHDKVIKGQPDRTTLLDVALPPFPESMRRANCQLIQDMFRHGYDAYMYHAYPAPELKPISCKPGTFNLVKIKALTLIDALDTLVILGNTTEFARSVERLRQLDLSMRRPRKALVRDDEDNNMTVTQGGLFAVDQNVSLFETNIRVLGGLLSAHQLAEAFLKNRVLESNVWDWRGDVLWGDSPSQSKGRRRQGAKSAPDQPASCSADLQQVIHQDDCSSMLQDVAPTAADENVLVKENLRQCRNTTTDKKQPESFWTYDGFLLTLARDIGTRLLPAFDSKTGIPYGTVNLLYGVPKGETTIASLAGGGTLTLEMELLSRLTGDDVFGRAAKLASRALWTRRSALNLFGKHINIHNGEWTETLSGIGSNSDSFYEYLVKHYILFPEDEDFWTLLISSYTGVHNSTRLGEWYADVDMNLGLRSGGTRRVFESLMAFYPGMQVLLGELPPAARTLNSFFMVREFLGFLPERFNYPNWRVDGGLRGAGRHPLRPEILESCYFLHRATKANLRRSSNATIDDDSWSARSTSGWLWAADFAVHALESMTRVTCGYASVKELSPTSSGAISLDGVTPAEIKLYNEMPSFFLSETLKYLYLTFDDDNVLHSDDQREWIFTTEAHPVHHEPIKTGRLNRKLDTMKQSLKQMLKIRLDGGHGTRKVYERSSVTEEKWTEHTKLKSYHTSYEHALTELKHRRKEHRLWHAGSSNRTGNVLIEPIVPPREISWGNDHFAERERSENWAHLSFASLGVGEGSVLTKACYNMYNPEFFWLKALRGGSLDYTDVYISVAADDPGKEFQPANRYMLLGSADALGYQGSSIYIGLPELQRQSDRSCTLTSQHQSGSKLTEVDGEQGPPEGADRYDMGPNVGSFDVSVFPDGGGFYVQHAESKERVVVTIIVDDASKDSFVMAYTSMPPLVESGQRRQSKATAETATGSSSRWTRWKNMFRRHGNRQESGAEKVQVPERSVVLSDMQGNAFICDVQIMLRSTVVEDESGVNAEERLDGDDDFTTKDEILAHFPCAPGFFGAAHLSNLIANDGLVIEEVIRAPDEGTEFGCDGGADVGASEDPPLVADIFSTMLSKRHADELGSRNFETCPNAVIQVVRRGTCTFEAKAMIQKRLNHASAVIVVNDVDEDLFVMSRGHDAEDKPGIPATVLVTGADGDGILSLINDHAKGEGHEDYLVARISLARQGHTGSNQEGQYVVDWSSETPIWPIVRASSEVIQIYARGGWGVHAVRNNELQGAWQLFLLQHQLHLLQHQLLSRKNNDNNEG